MINVTVGEQKTQSEKPFPKLMKNEDGDIFFMVRKKYGLPLTGAGWSYSLQNFADFSGTRYEFTDFDSSISIQNA